MLCLFSNYCMLIVIVEYQYDCHFATVASISSSLVAIATKQRRRYLRNSEMAIVLVLYIDDHYLGTAVFRKERHHGLEP